MRARPRCAPGSIPAGVHDDEDVRGYFASHIVEDCELWVRRARPAPSPASSCSRATGSTSSTSTRRAPAAGSAARLLAVAKRERPHGLRLWTFASNTGAQRFYERHGFVEVRRTDGRDNEERAPDVLYAYCARGSPQVPL